MEDGLADAMALARHTTDGWFEDLTRQAVDDQQMGAVRGTAEALRIERAATDAFIRAKVLQFLHEIQARAATNDEAAT